MSTEDLQKTFKGLFDAVTKPKQGSTFEDEMKLFKICQASMSLEQLSASNGNQLGIVPDVSVLNEVLRGCASKGDATKAITILQRMTKDFGVRPTDKSREIVAYACVKAGDHDKALQLLTSLDVISNLGQFVVWRMIRDCLAKDESDKAWDLFDGLRSKVLPAPEICGSMLMNCGKHDMVEKAFKTYRELQAQGLTPHWITHSALIYAASKRKEYYEKATELFREMESTRMQMDIRVYNNMLQATSKTADVATALELWNRLQDSEDEKLQINSITVSNMLWTLASVETAVDKISKRPYHYDMNPDELKRTAKEVFDYAVTKEITPNAFMLNAYLAVMANHNEVEDAEPIFNSTFGKFNVTPTPATYEIMLKMYDASQNYAKTCEILELAKQKNVPLGIEAWRAAVRTAALTKHLPEAVDWLKSMVAAGHRPSVDSLRVLHLRLCEEEKWQLRKEMGELCLPPVVIPTNPYQAWRQRSASLAELLAKVYGKAAPKLATKLD